MKLFFKRLGAFFLDCTILFFALTFINLFIPTFVDINDLNDRTMEITEKYINGEVTQEKFVEETNEISYLLQKGTYLTTITGIVIYILYFVVYQAYNNGQTLGKKVFKIRVIKMDDNIPTINTLIRRCLIPYGILVNFVLAILILVLNKNIYNTVNVVLTNLHLVVLGISILGMLIKRRGIHDYLANTKVEEV